MRAIRSRHPLYEEEEEERWDREQYIPPRERLEERYRRLSPAEMEGRERERREPYYRERYGRYPEEDMYYDAYLDEEKRREEERRRRLEEERRRRYALERAAREEEYRRAYPDYRKDYRRGYYDDYELEYRKRNRLDEFDRRPPYKDLDLDMTYEEYEQRRRNWEREAMERSERREGRKKVLSQPILTYIRPDYTTTVLVLRWIEFMFERVKRDKISLLLDYYKDVGWISDEVKAQIMSYARGEIQDVTSYEPDEDLLAMDKEDFPSDYKKVDDWRLSAEDHLKSLLFIEKIAGRVVNKDSLNSLEQEISKFKKNLEGYHGV